jgi:hypothetical protein
MDAGVNVLNFPNIASWYICLTDINQVSVQNYVEQKKHCKMKMEEAVGLFQK